MFTPGDGVGIHLGREGDGSSFPAPPPPPFHLGVLGLVFILTCTHLPGSFTLFIIYFGFVVGVVSVFPPLIPSFKWF